jgi:hypothetical protein
MTTDQQEARLSPASLMWGIFWRSVVWYTATGAVLGGLYGCSFVSLAIFSFDAGDGAGDVPVWAIRMMVIFCGVAGFVAGWFLARSIAKELRPLLGAVIGAMVGIPLGGFYFVFAYLIAFPAGVIFGGTYGLAAGLVNAVLLTVVTRLFFVPLSDPQNYRRAAVATNMLGVMVVPGFWGVSLLFFPGQGGVSGLTGSASVDLWIYIGLPSLILLLTAQWFGGLLAGWYAHSLASGPSSGQWYRDAHVRKAALISLGLMLAVGAELAGSAAYRAHQNRHVEIHVPAGGIAIYPEADRFTVSTDSDYQVWSLSGRREISSVPWPDDGPVQLSPDGRLIASHYCKRIVFDYCTGDEYGVKVLRARDGATVAERQLSAGGADLLRWTPDSSTLATFLHNSNDLQLLDMPEARPVRTTRINDDLGPELAEFAPDGNVLATSHFRATKLWNVEDGKLLHALPESYYMNALAFSPDGKLLATGGTGGEITLWSVEKGQAIRELAYTGVDTTALAFDPDGDLLATGSAYGEVHLRRTSDGELLKTYEGHENSVTDVAFSPDEQRIISGGVDRRVLIWPVREES